MDATADLLRVLVAISAEAAAEARTVLATMRLEHLDKGQEVPALDLDLWRLRVDAWAALVDLCGEHLGAAERIAPLKAWLTAVRPD